MKSVNRPLKTTRKHLNKMDDRRVAQNIFGTGCLTKALAAQKVPLPLTYVPTKLRLSYRYVVVTAHNHSTRQALYV